MSELLAIESVTAIIALQDVIDITCSICGKTHRCIVDFPAHGRFVNSIAEDCYDNLIKNHIMQAVNRVMGFELFNTDGVINNLLVSSFSSALFDAQDISWLTFVHRVYLGCHIGDVIKMVIDDLPNDSMDNVKKTFKALKKLDSIK
jgi:hypothetical protein